MQTLSWKCLALMAIALCSLAMAVPLPQEIDTDDVPSPLAAAVSNFDNHPQFQLIVLTRSFSQVFHTFVQSLVHFSLIDSFVCKWFDYDLWLRFAWFQLRSILLYFWKERNEKKHFLAFGNCAVAFRRVFHIQFDARSRFFYLEAIWLTVPNETWCKSEREFISSVIETVALCPIERKLSKYKQQPWVRNVNHLHAFDSLF